MTYASAPSPEELVELVRKNPLMSSIDRSHLTGLQDELEWVALAADEVLFHEGDPVDSCYFAIDGLLEVSTLQQDRDGNPDNDVLVLAEVRPGDTVGEMQILIGGTRTATVRAREASHLVRFSREGFDRFLASDRRVVAELTKTILPRLFRDQMVEVLPALFGELDNATLRDLEAKMDWVHLPRGETLFHQGEPSDSFYIIISGRLQVLIQEPSRRERMVGEIAQGECAGEMGVFTGEPRSATVTAIRDSELLEFSQEEFQDFTRQYPHMMQQMTQLLIKRLRRVYRQTPALQLSSNILLAAASVGLALDEFALQFTEAIEKLGSCLLLTSRRVDALLGMPGISQANDCDPDDLRLRSWLNQQEKTYRFIVYQPDDTNTDWTRRCIRQADEILYVGEASGSTELTEFEQEVLRQEQENRTGRLRSLVLLHPRNAQQPRGTIHWIEKRQVDRHLHVRWDRREDFERLARFLAGRAIGLALSGGGARGFAHVGIIRAMRELGIPIDMIAGVSMGSLVAAGYAYAGDDFDDMVARIKAQLNGALNDYTFPAVAIARGRRFDRLLRYLFQDVQIEDLWLPYFCVSSNLTQANIEVHRAGPLWRSVRASGSLPGIVPPVIRDGDLLYDGCLLDNLPMDVMREQVGQGSVIAVDVVPPVDLEVHVSPVDSPSGWKILWSRLNPFVRRINLPSIFSILHRAGELGSVYGRQKLIDERIADLYLRPPVEQFEIVDFNSVDDTSRIGLEFGKRELATWWAREQDKLRANAS